MRDAVKEALRGVITDIEAAIGELDDGPSAVADEPEARAAYDTYTGGSGTTWLDLHPGERERWKSVVQAALDVRGDE